MEASVTFDGSLYTELLGVVNKSCLVKIAEVLGIPIQQQGRKEAIIDEIAPRCPKDESEARKFLDRHFKGHELEEYVTKWVPGWKARPTKKDNINVIIDYWRSRARPSVGRLAEEEKRLKEEEEKKRQALEEERRRAEEEARRRKQLEEDFKEFKKEKQALRRNYKAQRQQLRSRYANTIREIKSGFAPPQIGDVSSPSSQLTSYTYSRPAQIGGFSSYQSSAQLAQQVSQPPLTTTEEETQGVKRKNNAGSPSLQKKEKKQKAKSKSKDTTSQQQEKGKKRKRGETEKTLQKKKRKKQKDKMTQKDVDVSQAQAGLVPEAMKGPSSSPASQQQYSSSQQPLKPHHAPQQSSLSPPLKPHHAPQQYSLSPPLKPHHAPQQYSPSPPKPHHAPQQQYSSPPPPPKPHAAHQVPFSEGNLSQTPCDEAWRVKKETFEEEPDLEKHQEKEVKKEQVAEDKKGFVKPLRGSSKRLPGAPKKACSALHYYRAANFHCYKSRNPTAQRREINSIMATVWRGLDASEKRKYEAMAEEDKVRYSRENTEFEQRMALGLANYRRQRRHLLLGERPDLANNEKGLEDAMDEEWRGLPPSARDEYARK